MERPARFQPVRVLARMEDQMRSVVSITADSDSSLRKWGQYPRANGEANRPPGVVDSLAIGEGVGRHAGGAS